MSDILPQSVHYVKRYEWFIIVVAVAVELWLLSVLPRLGALGRTALVTYACLSVMAIVVPLGLYYRATVRRADDMRGYPTDG